MNERQNCKALCLEGRNALMKCSPFPVQILCNVTFLSYNNKKTQGVGIVVEFSTRVNLPWKQINFVSNVQSGSTSDCINVYPKGKLSGIFTWIGVLLFVLALWLSCGFVLWGHDEKCIWLEWQLISGRVTEFVDCNTLEKPNQKEKGRLEKRETLRKPIITNSQANGPSRHTTT